MKTTSILRPVAAILGVFTAFAVLSPKEASAQSHCYDTRYRVTPSYHHYGHTRVVSRAPVYYHNAAVYVAPSRHVVRHHPRVIVQHAPRPIVRYAPRRVYRERAYSHHHHRDSRYDRRYHRASSRYHR